MPSSNEKLPINFNSISELNKHTEVKINIKTAFQCKQYCKTANDIYKKAEALYQKGDEENAYILYMRYFYIVQTIKKNYEFVKAKNVYNPILQQSSIGAAVEKAEKLQQSLDVRYEKKKKDLEAKKELEQQLVFERQNSKQKLDDNLKKIDTSFVDDLILPDVPSADHKLPSTESNGDNISDHAPQKPVVQNNSINDLSNGLNHEKTILVPQKPVAGYISVFDFYSLLKNSKGNLDSILVIDVRTNEEYLEASLSHCCMINVPETLLQYGANINSVERKLSRSTWEIWATRYEKKYLIIADYDFDDEIASPSCPAYILQDILCKFEGCYQVLILVGGFKEWHLHYPSLTSNPTYSKKPAFTKLIDPSLILQNLTYPELPSAFGKSIRQNNKSDDTVIDLNSIKPKIYPDVSLPSSNLTGTNKASLSSTDKLAEMRRFLSESGNEKEVDIILPNTALSNTTTPTMETTNSDTKTTHDSQKEMHTVTPQVESVKKLGPDLRNLPNIPGSLQEPKEKSTIKAESVISPISQIPKSLSGISDIKIDNGTYIQPSPQSSITSQIPKTNVTTTPTLISRSETIPDSKPALDLGNNLSQNIVINKKPHQQINQINHSNTSIPNTINPVTIPPNDVPAQQIGNQNLQNVSLKSQQRQNLVSNKVLYQHPNSINNQSNTTITPPNNVSTGNQQIRKGNLQENQIKIPAVTSHPANKLSGMNQPQCPPSTSKSDVFTHKDTNPTQQTKLLPTTGHSVVPKQTNVLQPSEKPLPNTTPPKKPVESKQHYSKPEHKPKQKFITTFGLPSGWEKAINHENGRIYYKDHNTQQTHWELPPEIQVQVMKTAEAIPKEDFEERKSQESKKSVNFSEDARPLMKRSFSSPNITEDVEKENRAPASVPSIPTIDRTNKPKVEKKVYADRSTKPLSSRRLNNLSAIPGGRGKCLTGLKNLGNTCYMNSVIQCLSNTIPLAEYFYSSKYEKDLNPRNLNARPTEIAREFAFIFGVLAVGKYISVSPVDIRRAVGRFSSQFSGHEQQDSHELLMFLLDGLHEDVNRIKIRQSIKERDNSNQLDSISAELAWRDYLLNNSSVVVDLFQGQFRSTVVCLSCHKRSKTFDAFNCLQLELPANRSGRLEDCIRSFTKAERIEGYNSWKCPHCKCYREAEKTIEIWKLPQILIVQLKRFRYDGRWHNKIQTNVNFPVQNFNISSYIANGATPKYTNYNLYGVINHYGSFESGHYTAYCQNAYNKRWYGYDDNLVKEVDSNSIKTNAAYLLFYTAVNFQ